MKKYLLLFLFAICVFTQVMAQEHTLNATLGKGKSVEISQADIDKYFGDWFQPVGVMWKKTETGFILTQSGAWVKIYAPNITGFPDIRGFLTIDAEKECPNMAMFTLTEDSEITKIKLPTHTNLKDVTLNNLPNLKEINFSECEGIENLVARKLPIDELNIGKSTLLKTLDCSNCELETLVIPEKSAVNKINCSGNSLSEEEVDKLIAALPATGGELCIYDETAENNNECTAKQVADAKAKNWKVVDATGKDYAGSGAVPNSLNSIKEDSNDNAPYYDLQGRRMQKPTRSGLYIHKGKKVIIK